jgi:hypothetical protein
LRFDQASKILLMEADAREGFDRALQFKQGEFGRHQLEHNRAVFHFRPQATHGGGQDPPVIEHHICFY